MGNVWEIFENMDEIVYVTDAETCELLYMNKKALDVFGCRSLEAVRGKPCYQVMHRCGGPCPDCEDREREPEPGAFRQRRYFDQRLKRHFLLRDTVLREEGRRCRLKLALDISVQERQGSMAKDVQNLEAVLNEGLRVALLEKTPDRSLEALLAYLGKALDGERAYIFERSASGGDDNTYEWTAPGVEPVKEQLQDLPAEVCANWYRSFRVGRHIVINDLEDIRDSDPLQYANLARQDIRSLVVVPLYDDGRLIGFYGVDNPPVKDLEYTSNMLQITAHFIVSTLRRRNLVRELQKRSCNVLSALNVDYLGIYQVNFDTDECVTYQETDGPRKKETVWFENGYQAAMDWYAREYVAGQDRDYFRTVTKKEYVQERLRAGRRFYARYQVRDNAYGIKHLEIHFAAGREEGNTAIFAFRDVNAVVEQEEQYRLETRQSLEDVLEGSRTGIWTIELEEGRPPRMYPDRTMRRLLGVEEGTGPEECYERWTQGIDGEYGQSVQEAVQEILETGRSEVVYPWSHPSLGKIYVRCGGVLDRKAKGPRIRLSGYHQDITEVTVTRKKQEQAIMELLEKVRRANSAKSEFLSHMSHDLRTPINGILGMLAVLEDGGAGPEKQQLCRRRIRVCAEHLLSLVNDVLLVSKLESGRPVEVEEPFNLHDVLEECVTILAPQAEEAGVRLTLEEVDLRHSRLVGNPLQVKQILMNTIDNAIKFNRPEGDVYVQVKELEGSQYRFIVEDTGIGIGEDFKPHLFEPFTQAHQGARTHYNGVGLGLSIVKKMTDMMGGGIEVTSQLGRGSLFQITLPLRPDAKWEAQPVEEERNVRADISGMRVLLVEDNEINCEIVEFMLGQVDAQVVTAKNGREAVELFAASEPGSFDCILMDLMMPVMSGFEAARTIRGMDRPDAETVPVIALSANAFEEDVTMAREAGMNAHLAKPVDINKMFKVMRRLRR